MKCQSCSAPLLANNQNCQYCGVRNDVDLQGKQTYEIINRQTPRICPECQLALQTIALKIQPPLQIERCETCFGLFFDPGEVETLLESLVAPVFHINHELIDHINQDRYAKQKPVKYLACPECQNIMSRMVFGHRSGVVIDRCHQHGVWLDGGEISHLLEWRKAGGQLLHDQQETPKKARPKSPAMAVEQWSKTTASLADEPDLLAQVTRLVFGLFDSTL